MRKNWLAATWVHQFRPEPLVPDAAFQQQGEPYPGHWRRFPTPWRADLAGEPNAHTRAAELSAALVRAVADLPALWQRVLTASARREDDRQPALSPVQRRDILSRARAAVRDQLDRTLDGPR